MSRLRVFRGQPERHIRPVAKAIGIHKNVVTSWGRCAAQTLEDVNPLDHICNLISTDMRYEPEHKTRTRDRIVRNAARKLRAEGLSGPGVASVMKASGLTVGGFYKHFGSKDELFVEAIAQAFSEFHDKVYSSLQSVPLEDRWRELVRWYLSPDHCDRPETGCPVAALAPEIARSKPGVRKRIAGLVKERADLLQDWMPGATAAERQRNLFIIFSAMTGAISMARLLTESADREKLLTGVREYLLHSF